MKTILKYLLPVLLAAIIMEKPALGQDHGQPDSIIVGDISANIGDTEAIVPVYAVTDDSVAFFNLPLITQAPLGGFHIQFALVVSDILSQWDEVFSDYIENDQYLRLFGIRDTGGEDNPPLHTDYQRIHILDLNVSIDPGTQDQYVQVINTDDPVGGPILAGLVDGTTEYTPSFKPGLITFGNPTGIDSDSPELPSSLILSQNYPNPFNPQTSIDFSLPADSRVDLEIYNLLGQHVRNLTMGNYAAGTYTVVWDGKDESGAEVPSGVYFYLLSTPEKTLSAKMLLIR